MRVLTRSIAAALTAAVTLTSLDLAPAYAAASKDKQAIQNTTTDFSAHRRRQHVAAERPGEVAQPRRLGLAPIPPIIETKTRPRRSPRRIPSSAMRTSCG